MEERLDDAINVLRSHCEPLNISGIDAASLSGHGASFVPTQTPQSQSSAAGSAAGLSQAQMPQDAAAVSLPIDLPVKIERTNVPSVSSTFYLFFFNLFLLAKSIDICKF